VGQGGLRTIIAIFFALLLVSLNGVAAADSPVDPRTQFQTSANGLYRVVLDPYSDEAAAAGRTPTLERDSGDGPRGDLVTLQRSEEGGRWRTIWSRYAPGADFGGYPEQALVSNNGHYVVIVGNYVGDDSSSNEVVIYNRNGRITRSLSLVEITSQFYFDLAPRSTSSVQWLGLQPVALSRQEDTVLLPIADPGYPAAEDREVEWPDTFYIQPIRLSDGALIALSTEQQRHIQRRLCLADFGRFTFETRLGSNAYGEPPLPVSIECQRARDAEQSKQLLLRSVGAVLGIVLLIVTALAWHRHRHRVGKS
jgi:hypothetical protein